MPSITKRGDNFRIVVSLGYGQDGRQIRKTATFKPPKDATAGKAEKLAWAFAHQYEQRCLGTAGLRENMRFSELAEWYFDRIAPDTLRETSLNTKRRLIELYVLPHIGHMTLGKINALKLDELWGTLRTNGRIRRGYILADKSAIPHGSHGATARLAGLVPATVHAAASGRSISGESARKLASALAKRPKELFEPSESNADGLDAATVKNVSRAVSSIYAAAVKKEIVAKNPVKNSTLPKSEEKARPFLDEGQCKQLLSALREETPPQLGAMIATLVYTGMRSGELLALRWGDIDFAAGIIVIRHTLHRVRGEYKLSPPKTKSSARAIKAPEAIVELLKGHRAWQEGRRRTLGAAWIDRGAVFTGETGEYHNRTYLNTAFKKLLKKHGLPDVRIHDLRHANASLLINAGVPLKVIAEHLGHRSVSTTERVYAHVFAESRARASDAIGRALSLEAGAGGGDAALTTV
jgi:integrase